MFRIKNTALDLSRETESIRGRARGTAFFVVAIAALLTPAATAQRAAAAAAPPPATAPPTPVAPAPPESIPISQVAPRAEELMSSLREMSHSSPTDSDLAAFAETLQQEEDAITTALNEASASLDGNSTVLQLREQSRQWRAFTLPEARQRKTLAEWGAACEASIEVLKREEAVWKATLENSRSAQEMKPVLARINEALTEIRRVRNQLDDRLHAVVKLQGRVSKRAVTVADTLDKLGETTRQFHGQLFHPDDHAIWELSARKSAPSDEFGTVLNRSLVRSYSNSAAFLQSRKGLIGSTIVLLALAFVLLHRVAGKTLRAADPDARTILALQILRRPISLAVLFVSPVALASLPLARMSVVFWLMQLFLLPVVRFLPLYAGSGARFVYFCAAFFALNGLVGVLDIGRGWTRDLTAILFAGGAALLAWWGRPGRFIRRPDKIPLTPRAAVVVRMSLGVLLVILTANVFGFLRLANLLRVATLLCSFIALVLYTLVRVGSTLLDAVLFAPRVKWFATVRQHGAGVARWTKRLLAAGAVACWTFVTLDLFALTSDVVDGVKAVLDARLEIKAFSISLGDVLGFVCVLVLGYLIAAAIRFVLREEVLSRFPLSRGIPEMISTSLYYVLLLMVFFMSLSAGGLQLDKLTVLTGAFGVGLGFGMQNLVSNFVSGLILQFERPIRTGDVLEVGTLSGEIKSIGIRASRMRTFQGAEVIIPNSAFIANQVINWTLSEPRRRVEINIGVAYGTDPERVIELLAGVARAHREVLREPAPSAYFKDFGPSSLDFVVMFWAEQDNHFRLRSEIAIGVNAALRDAGIEIPFPQQDVHVRTTAPSPRSTASA
jgi:small-conductance mechanosensitive channel